MSEPRIIKLGDMDVIGQWPGKIYKALAVIAGTLHPTYDTLPDVPRGWSKQTCMFSSLAVRDFLVAIGYPDATGRSVSVVMSSHDKDGVMIHSLGIGVPDDRRVIADKFNGHLVCTVPSLNLLIDPTLYQAQRPQWNGALPGMMALDYGPPADRLIRNQRPITAHYLTAPATGQKFNIVWLDRPELKWKREEDFKRNDRRRAVTAAMIERFGEWRD